MASIFRVTASNLFSLGLGLDMAIFLDVHKVPFSEENLKELCGSPRDEFGVSHVNLFYNKDANVCFCLLDAPDKDAVEKHHSRANIKCEWITEVKMATGDSIPKSSE
jgi:hypothetical protein